MARSKKVGREEAWVAFAERHGGEVARDRKDRIDAVRVAHGDWTVVVDTYTLSGGAGQSATTYTRGLAGFHAQVPFRCKVWREGFFSRIAKRLGMRDLTVGRPRLDREFVVQSDSPGHVRSLLAGSRVGELLERNPKFQYEVRKKKGSDEEEEGADAEVQVQVAEVLNEGERLDAILDVCRESLDALVRSGVAIPPSGRHPM